MCHDAPNKHWRPCRPHQLRAPPSMCDPRLEAELGPRLKLMGLCGLLTTLRWQLDQHATCVPEMLAESDRSLRRLQAHWQGFQGLPLKRSVVPLVSTPSRQSLKASGANPTSNKGYGLLAGLSRQWSALGSPRYPDQPDPGGPSHLDVGLPESGSSPKPFLLQSLTRTRASGPQCSLGWRPSSHSATLLHTTATRWVRGPNTCCPRSTEWCPDLSPFWA